jgi:pyruvate/2-oxoacid:ferredoxin oxidoreductase alpha subunit
MNTPQGAAAVATPAGPAADSVLLTGNQAVAWGARLSRPQVCPVYPITPQTPVLEQLTAFQAAGEFDAEIITPESEHSVMSACIPASLTGVRVFTATASQGLLLMHELLHYASGARAPIVMANVNRTVASPWAFWPDQTDSLAQRDTGWMQFYVETAQEALDTTIQAFRVAEQLLIPALVNLDAFYVSHAMEPVRLPAQAVVDRYLPAFNAAAPARPRQRRVLGQRGHARHVLPPPSGAGGRHGARAPALAAEADREWAALTGRSWGVVERYRCEGARTAIVTMGSMCGTAREAVDLMRDAGQPVGLVKLRLFRPLPVQALREALADISELIVLDRNHSPGCGGILHQELRGALYGTSVQPRIHGLLAGVGGVNVSPDKIVEFVQQTAQREALPESQWVR